MPNPRLVMTDAVLHTRFKARCAAQGVSMTDVVERLITTWLDGRVPPASAVLEAEARAPLPDGWPGRTSLQNGDTGAVRSVALPKPAGAEAILTTERTPKATHPRLPGAKGKTSASLPAKQAHGNPKPKKQAVWGMGAPHDPPASVCRKCGHLEKVHTPKCGYMGCMCRAFLPQAGVQSEPL